jgi:hypothetical protein
MPCRLTFDGKEAVLLPEGMVSATCGKETLVKSAALPTKS